MTSINTVMLQKTSVYRSQSSFQECCHKAAIAFLEHIYFATLFCSVEAALASVFILIDLIQFLVSVLSFLLPFTVYSQCVKHLQKQASIRFPNILRHSEWSPGGKLCVCPITFIRLK